MANLATRTGRFEMAAARLDACLAAGLTIPPSGVPASTGPSLPAIAPGLAPPCPTSPPTASHPAKPFAPHWLAARRGDAGRGACRAGGCRRGEYRRHRGLGATGHAGHRGGPPRRTRSQRRKAELDGTKQRYLQLYKENNPTADAAEMARFAGALGYSFEAIGFAVLPFLVPLVLRSRKKSQRGADL